MAFVEQGLNIAKEIINRRLINFTFTVCSIRHDQSQNARVDVLETIAKNGFDT